MTLVLTALVLLSSSLPPMTAETDYHPVVKASVGTTTRASCLVVMDGEVWAGTVGGGMVNLDRPEAAPLDASRGLPGNRVNDCLVFDEELWVATDRGLANFPGESDAFEVYEDGRFLRLSRAGERVLAARDDGTLLSFAPGAIEPERLPLDKTVIALAGAADGRYATGSIDGTIRIGGPNGWRRTVRAGLPVVALAWHRDELRALLPGQLMAVGEGGLSPLAEPTGPVALSKDGQALVAPALARFEVAAVLQHGPRWYAATDAGVWVGEGPKEESLAWRKLPAVGCPCGPRIAALASYNGALWVGGFDTGLCRFDGHRWQQYRAPEHLPSDMVNEMTVGRDRLYVATLKGLVVVDDKGHFTRHTRSQCVDNIGANCPWYESVTGVASDQANRNVWVADTGSVHRWSSRKWKHLYRKAGVNSEKITRIAAHGGKLAVGTSDRGVLVSDARLNFHAHDDQGGLADNWVMDLSYDRSGALWVATCTRGISRFYQGQWRSWTQADGLADDYTLSIREIDGRIWVGHFRGVSILTEQGIIHVAPEDGLSGGEVHDIVKHDGRIYLATDSGVSILET